jgi:FKBP-type peptidyl-prolyl cis-trans isomerase FkpA
MDWPDGAGRQLPALLPGVCVTLLRVFRRTGAWVALAAMPLVAAGCTGSPTEPTDYAPFSKTDLRVGDGTTANIGNVVTVNYWGWLFDASKPDQKGALFETSIGSATFSFVLGAGQVITGWDEGLIGMNVGGLRRLILPPSKAYGPSRNGIIPPNATLVFEIELVAVE